MESSESSPSGGPDRSFRQRRAAALRRLAFDYWRQARHTTNRQAKVMLTWARRLEDEARRLESPPA
ncbi:MAG TPA: hypothetical protein VFA11_10775 [Acidimicrobiales bacterium]|nr:hypothetical protein [Acidimicrobiales bacterium]